MECLDTTQRGIIEGFFNSHTTVGVEIVTDRGDSYEEYVRELIVASRLGLEMHTVLENIEEYLAGYFCRGVISYTK
eukprot:9581028-Ditylum_brightwellii.AAC.1